MREEAPEGRHGDGLGDFGREGLRHVDQDRLGLGDHAAGRLRLPGQLVRQLVGLLVVLVHVRVAVVARDLQGRPLPTHGVRVERVQRGKVVAQLEDLEACGVSRVSG